MKNILLAVVCAFCLSACTSEPELFTGNDNYIISFSLKQGENIYYASINENTIEIEVPELVSLNGAVASCVVSERAVIEPSIASITEWDKPIDFTVTSFSGTKRYYTYECKKNKDIPTQTFIFKTQAELDDFAQLKLTHIDGGLIIGQDKALDAKDSISDLSAFNSLESVSGNIVFKSSIKLANINGFTNLQKSGSIYLGTINRAIDLSDTLSIDMPMLKDAGELIFNSNLISHISMPKLETAQQLFIQSLSLKSIQFDKLNNVLGGLLVSGNNGFMSNKFVESINFEQLQSILGELKIEKFSNITSIDLANLKSVEGDFSLTNLPILADIQLVNLEVVEGGMILKEPNGLTKFHTPKLQTIGTFRLEGPYSNQPEISLDFSSLRSIENDFVITRTKTDAIVLPNLEYIGNSVELGTMSLVSEFMVPKLKHCKEIELWMLDAIESVNFSSIENEVNLEFTSCPKLLKIKALKVKNIILNGGSKLSEIPEFEGFTEISGELKLSNYSKNDNISILKFKKIGSLVNISGASNTILGLPDLEEINDINVGGTFIKGLLLPRLKQVNNNLKICFWDMDEEGIDVSKLEKVGGEFYIQGATGSWAAGPRPLKNLGCFETLKEVGSAKIEWFGKLTDFSGLQNIIPSLSADKWFVQGCAYNPTYEDMLNGNYVEEDL